MVYFSESRPNPCFRFDGQAEEIHWWFERAIEEGKGSRKKPKEKKGRKVGIGWCKPDNFSRKGHTRGLRRGASRFRCFFLEPCHRRRRQGVLKRAPISGHPSALF